MTVSPDTKQRVLDAADALGYVVSSSASGLASGRTRNIGIVVPFMSRWYYTQVIERAQRELMKSGYDVTLYNLSASDQQRDQVFGELLHRQRVDAGIAVSLELTPTQIDALHAVGKPVVGVGVQFPAFPPSASTMLRQPAKPPPTSSRWVTPRSGQSTGEHTESQTFTSPPRGFLVL